MIRVNIDDECYKCFERHTIMIMSLVTPVLMMMLMLAVVTTLCAEDAVWPGCVVVCV